MTLVELHSCLNLAEAATGEAGRTAPAPAPPPAFPPMRAPGTCGPSPNPLSLPRMGTLPSTMRLPRPQKTSGGSKEEERSATAGGDTGGSDWGGGAIIIDNGCCC